MQPLSIGERVFGMNDASPGSHQVDLAGADDLFVAQAVAMQYFTIDQPGKGLQANVRMGADMHALARGEADRAGVVEKTPGANHALLAGGQRSANQHAFAKVGATRLGADDGAHGLPPLVFRVVNVVGLQNWWA